MIIFLTNGACMILETLTLNIVSSLQLYRVSGRTVLCYPLTFSATDFYLGHDLALLTANIKSDLRFVSQRWNQEGQYGTVASTNRTRSSIVNDISRPTYCIVRNHFRVDLPLDN